MVMAMFFIKLYAYYKPFEDDLVDTDAEVAQYQVFFAMFLLLIIQNGVFKEYYFCLPLIYMFVVPKI